MTPTHGFNLIEEPWVPVLRRDGTTQDASLRTVLHDAADLRAIACDPPVLDLPILRLLLAILYRAAGEKITPRLWARWWDAGIPTDLVDGYLDTWAHRFDLADQDTPFYQIADACGAAANTDPTLERLVADMDSADGLFDSRAKDPISPADAARWLVHLHAYDTAGIKTSQDGANKGRSYGNQPGWLGNAGPVFLEGRNLARTLLLNLVPQSPETDWAADLPVWELPPKKARSERAPERFLSGPVGLYTLQPRQVKLSFHEGMVAAAHIGGDGEAIARHAVYGIDQLTSWWWKETTPKTTERAEVPAHYAARGHREGVAMWRRISALLSVQGGGNVTKDGPAEFQAPGVITWLARARENELIDDSETVVIRAAGRVYVDEKKGKFTGEYDDRLPLSVVLLRQDHAALATAAEDAVALAGAAVRAVRRLEADLSTATTGTKDARNGATARAYASIDVAFREWFARIAGPGSAQEKLGEWAQTLKKLLGRLGDEMVSETGPAGLAGWDGFTSARADLRFRRALSEALGGALVAARP